jgi:uncharacterized repeat protein (TIGR03803 family)
VNGGSSGYGTVFSVTASGVLTSLYSFTNGNDGANPYAGLVQGSDGNFYGTTANGGSGGSGTLFMVMTNGTLITLTSFAGANGANPYGGLIQDSNGNFHGTTVNGGTNGGGGTVFMLSTNGTFTVLLSFVKTFAQGTTIWIYPDGGNPYGGLIQGRDGNFYGTAVNGTKSGYNTFGTVFEMTTNGTLTTVYQFGSSSTLNGYSLVGSQPYGGLVQGSDGSLYGTTLRGGANTDGYMDSGRLGFGTVFQLATNGTLTTLISFAHSNGANPYAGPVQGSDGTLYGTTYTGGAYADTLDDGYGTVFQIILPPRILNQPTNETVSAGGSAAFTVGINGVGPITYQWRKNGANIAGAISSSLVLTNISANSSGSYSVTVSNAGGTTVSSNAILIVICPTITVNPATLSTAMIGVPYNQTNTAYGGVGPYTYRKTSGNLPLGFTLSSSGVLSGTPNRTGNYIFTISATDFDGCVGTNKLSLAVENYLIFVNPYLDSNGWFHAQLNVPASSNFVIVASTNITLPLSNWTSLTTNNAPNGIFFFTDSNGIGSTNSWPQRFYRATPPQ